MQQAPCYTHQAGARQAAARESPSKGVKREQPPSDSSTAERRQAVQPFSAAGHEQARQAQRRAPGEEEGAPLLQRTRRSTAASRLAPARSPNAVAQHRQACVQTRTGAHRLSGGEAVRAQLHVGGTRQPFFSPSEQNVNFAVPQEEEEEKSP